MRLLLTRPREDSEALAEVLRLRGHQTLIEPLLSIAYEIGVPVDLDGVQAILVTSANGARALAAIDERRELPVFAVGDASARAAIEAGFATVESARGDVESLADLVTRSLDATAGAVLHVAGSQVAGDLAGRLEAAGLTCRRAVLYHAEKAKSLSLRAVRALREGEVDGVLFFSPRTAVTFVSVARSAGLDGACAGLRAFCLSPAVAEKARVLVWRQVCIATRPDQESLLASIDETTHRSDTGA
jgi:uroporphyrinogen-III synthase